jgi:hypothetical protein
MAPRKILILHAGMGKTGTTALQKALWHNRDALARAGIAYPAIGATAGAHHLVSPHVLPHLAHRAPWRRYLAPAKWLGKVAALPEPRVLMSSELVSSADPDRVAAFCAALAPHVDLHLCLYLRRQDDMMAAVYAQGVKGGVQRRPLSQLIDSRLGRYDYMDRLAPWEAALGRDRMIIRPYERSQFHQGDLIRDFFLHVLGLPDLPPGFVHDPAADLNARLSVPATEFKRLVNLLIPDRSRTRPYVAALAACPPDPRGTHHLGRAERARLIAHYADSNAQVARTYMNRPAGDLFHDPLPANAPAEAPSVGPADLRAVADVLGQQAPALLHDLAALTAPGHPLPRDHAVHEAAARLREAMAGLDLPPRPLGYGLRPDRLARSLGRIARGNRPAAPPPPPPKPAPRPATAPPRGPDEILVHFGIRKTGSTSIQETLLHNGDRLGTTRYLAFGMANSSFMVRNLFRWPDRLTPDRRQMFETRFTRGLAGLGPVPRAIFSAETISDLDIPALRALIAALSATGAKIRFTGYMRDPVGYQRSVFQEQLKYTYDGFFPSGPAEELVSNHHRIVDRLDRVAGRANVTVHPFDRALFPGGDVVRHFLDGAGIDATGLTLCHVNESLSLTAVKALHVYRRLRVANDSDIGHDASRDGFITSLASLDGPAFRFAPEIDARIAAANSHILDWSETRLDHRLAAPPRDDDDGIATEADLARFTPEELDRIDALARAAGLPGLPAGTDAAEAVADLLHALRLHHARAAA